MALLSRLFLRKNSLPAAHLRFQKWPYLGNGVVALRNCISQFLCLSTDRKTIPQHKMLLSRIRYSSGSKSYEFDWTKWVQLDSVRIGNNYKKFYVNFCQDKETDLYLMQIASKSMGRVSYITIFNLRDFVSSVTDLRRAFPQLKDLTIQNEIPSDIAKFSFSCITDPKRGHDLEPQVKFIDYELNLKVVLSEYGPNKPSPTIIVFREEDFEDFCRLLPRFMRTAGWNKET